jgi:hypothetical protein
MSQSIFYQKAFEMMPSSFVIVGFYEDEDDFWLLGLKTNTQNVIFRMVPLLKSDGSLNRLFYQQQSIPLHTGYDSYCIPIYLCIRKIWHHLHDFEFQKFFIQKDQTNHLADCKGIFENYPSGHTQCASCGARIEIKWHPNRNRKSFEIHQRMKQIWAIWEETTLNSFIVFFPEELVIAVEECLFFN